MPIRSIKIFTLLFFLSLVLSALIVDRPAAAIGVPKTQIKHQAVTTFAPFHRIHLKTQMEDDDGITLARCYFRYRPTGSYYFVDMTPAGQGTYQTILPAPGETIDRIEYFFLVENSQNQVIRSISFFAEKERLGTLQDRQITGSSQEVTINIQSESHEIELNDFEDNNMAGRKQAGPLRRYGLIVGNDSEPASGAPVSGYFGGFKLHENGVNPMAIMGTGVGLSTDDSVGAAEGDEEIGTATPDVRGSGWSGIFYVTQSSYRERITAVVYQSGNSVVIQTSRSGLGGYFSGSINQDGDMYLYDRYDGEIWTTYYGPATSTSITIADYVRKPSPVDPNPPLYVISLSRTISPDLPPSFPPAVLFLLDQL